MLPVLFKIGSFNFQTNFITLPIVSSFFVILGWKRLKNIGYKDDEISLIIFLIFLSWLVFSRIISLISGELSFLDFFLIWKGGNPMILGIMGPMISMTIYLLLKRKNIAEFFDAMVPVVSLSLASYRLLVCLPTGCCFGKPFKFGLVFKEGSVAYYQALFHLGSLRLHPTQIYDAVFMLLTFIILEKANFKHRGDKTLFFLFMLSLMRLIVDNFRGDIKEFFIIFQLPSFQGITWWQILSVFLFLCGVYWIKVLRIRV